MEADPSPTAPGDVDVDGDVHGVPAVDHNRAKVDVAAQVALKPGAAVAVGKEAVEEALEEG
jgi:hypothetical protein